MNHFTGRIQGNTDDVVEAHGTAESGIDVEAYAFSVGARISIVHHDGRDVVRVYRTGGAHGQTGAVLVAEFDQRSGQHAYTDGAVVR